MKSRTTNKLPLNPIYEKNFLSPNLEHLRDGTWTPHQMSDSFGHRQWIAYHYPEHIEDYYKAFIALKGGK